MGRPSEPPPTMRPTVRPAVAGDVAVLSSLLASAGLTTVELEHHLRHFLVAERLGVVVGCVGAERSDVPIALLRSLCVVDGARGEGIGGTLCDALEARLADDGVRDVYLLTETAERFFARRGFHTLGSVASAPEAPPFIRATSQMRGACCASALLMHKRLGHSE